MFESAYAARKLSASGIEFVPAVCGVKFELAKANQVIDFWPSTGRWWIRGTSNKRCGLNKLIAYMKKKDDSGRH